MTDALRSNVIEGSAFRNSTDTPLLDGEGVSGWVAASVLVEEDGAVLRRQVVNHCRDIQNGIRGGLSSIRPSPSSNII